jgi:hypothetical protein
MYPMSQNIIYQISVGMKKGPYFVQTEIPYGTIPIYQLGSSAITPNLNDPVYRYLGAKYPKDSPVDTPTWFLYTIMNAPQIVLISFMDGGDTMAIVGGVPTLFGKATIDFRVNKAVLQQITLGTTAALAITYGSGAQFTVPSGQVAVVTGGPNGDTTISAASKPTTGVASGNDIVAPTGWTVTTGSGSAVLTTMEDVRKWRSIQDNALYIPYYSELTGF